MLRLFALTLVENLGTRSCIRTVRNETTIKSRSGRPHKTYRLPNQPLLYVEVHEYLFVGFTSAK